MAAFSKSGCEVITAMFMVISYDIADDKRRAKVAKLLEGYGERVQDSVFECILRPTQLRELRRRMLPLLDHREDSVRFYFLPKNEVLNIKVLGKGSVTREERLFLV